MNNDIFNIDFTRMLPPSLKNDENMLALAGVIGGELQKTSRMARLNIIYARIDELTEDVLDVLAYDLHVDWYDYTYPIEAKRALIKDSVKVHKRLGTKYAVETALGNLHPNSYIEEWFEYKGEPFSFRVILDTTHSRVGAGYSVIKKAVDSYKRLSAHMDSLIYQCNIGLSIEYETKGFEYSTGMTGKVIAGTAPQRNIIGAIEEAGFELLGSSDKFKYTSPNAGTIPKRSTIAALTESKLNTPADGEGFPYSTGMTGKVIAGTAPQRNIIGAIEEAGFEVLGSSDNFNYTSPSTGTIPKRSTMATLTEGKLNAPADGEGFTYSAGMTGKEIAGAEPQRNVKADINNGGLSQTVATESYKYNVKRCGTKRCKS